MLDYFKKLVGDKQDKEIVYLSIKGLQQINELEPEIEKLTDDELRAKTTYFKEQIAKRKIGFRYSG